MYFNKTILNGTAEILASNDYQAVPIEVTETSEVLAGMPITQAGKSAPTGANAVGILLYDVDPTHNPNGAIVVDGIIDWGKCKTHNTAITATAANIAKVLPKITFRENGVTYNWTAATSG